MGEGNIVRTPKISCDSSIQKKAIALSMNDCLAKTYLSNGGQKLAGRTVLEHCAIVGEVAREILDRMPDWLRIALFPAGSELVAAAHDIGKISPTFQEKIYRGTSGYSDNSKQGLECANPDLEKDWGGHAGVSMAATDHYGGLDLGKFIPQILGQHHGYLPLLDGKTAIADVFGGQVWQKQREMLVEKLKLALNCRDWPIVSSDLHAMVLAGLTTVSDWIGSSVWFEDPQQSWEPLISKALDHAGFVQPKLISGLSFYEIFNFILRDAQEKLIANVVQPGVYIMEAPMGLGKTEAALYAAYLMMVADKATGIYFALPTQLTSDKIHDRVNSFLQKILALDCRHREAMLLHSNAWLKRAMESEMGKEGQPGGSWFEAKKRGILAPFAVGTIDQALMAVMNVKHGFVRTFGLAGKVVILDEVHSYDAYTGTILDELVKALRELHCTVIILSATLTQDRRQILLGSKYPLAERGYPLISAVPKDNNQSKPQEIFVEPLPNVKVGIQLCQDSARDAKAIDEALFRAEQGQQVLWIENTVNEAQDKYRYLAAKAADMNIACGLLHSRFLKTDRDRNEAHWVTLFGKDNSTERKKQGRILVGTQVLEQSLDIDADFLVTRMCPTDMLLQRLGRLWRHEKTWRPEASAQEAWILTPTLADACNNPKKAFGKSANIYSPYVLYRSLEVWEKVWRSDQSIILPRDIRALIEATYVERDEPASIHRYQSELEKKRETLERLAFVGISKGGATLPENKASTRYSEQDDVEVLLLRSSHRSKNGNKPGTFITLLSGEELYLPQNRKVHDRRERRKIAAILTTNTVRVAEYLVPQAVLAKNLAWLKDYLYLGNRDYKESLLRVAIVLQEDGNLIALDRGVASADYCLSYDERLGYQAEKRQK